MFKLFVKLNANEINWTENELKEGYKVRNSMSH